MGLVIGNYRRSLAQIFDGFDPVLPFTLVIYQEFVQTVSNWIRNIDYHSAFGALNWRPEHESNV